jgi:hypothetical protein
LLFEGEVGVDVDLGGGDLLVAEPQGDDGGVDAGVQQPHGGGMAQHVRGELLAGEGRAGRRGGGGVDGQALLDGVGAEWGAAAGRKQRVGGLAGVFDKPGA